MPTLEDVPLLVYYSFLSVAKTIIIASCGAALARAGILTASTKKSMSDLVFWLFSPALLFSTMSESVNLHNMLQWWPLVVFPLLYCLIGFTLGHLIVYCVPNFIKDPYTTAQLARSPSTASLMLNSDLTTSSSLSDSDVEAPGDDIVGRDRYAFLIQEKRKEVGACAAASLALHNSGNLPLALVLSLTTDISPWAEEGEASTKRGIAYVSVFMSVTAILVWTLGYNYIGTGALKHQKAVEAFNETSNPQIALKERSSTRADHENVASNDTDVDASPDETEESAEDQQQQLQAESFTMRARSKLHAIVRSTTFKQVVTPMTCSLVAALTIALIPPIKSLFYGHKPPLKFIMDTAYFLGLPSAPTVLVVLGASLGATGPGAVDKNISKWLIGGITVGKVIVMPLIGTAITYAVYHLGLIPKDPLFAFTLVVQSAVPSASVLVIIAELHQYGNTMMSRFQLWQYALGIVSITSFMTLALVLFS
eukprot:TRINITY_DN8153_c0_g1_i2.p1 TRINITY_DN8153_c0_g1~~TRINITY_DN8153_c0_g1_i2.p1  ORF type:complete len:480 (+),score=60.83 TRINITY_DN8153_c0_g1_i2:91-1530(+)